MFVFSKQSNMIWTSPLNFNGKAAVGLNDTIALIPIEDCRSLPQIVTLQHGHIGPNWKTKNNSQKLASNVGQWILEQLQALKLKSLLSGSVYKCKLLPWFHGSQLKQACIFFCIAFFSLYSIKWGNSNANPTVLFSSSFEFSLLLLLVVYRTIIQYFSFFFLCIT